MKNKILNITAGALFLALAVVAFYWYAQYRGQRDEYKQIYQEQQRFWLHREDSIQLYHEGQMDSLANKVKSRTATINNIKKSMRNEVNYIDTVQPVKYDSLWTNYGF
jgi:hypothetical protein